MTESSPILEASLHIGDQVVLDSQHLQHLLDALRNNGYQVVGPTMRDSAIVYDDIATVDELPAGWGDEQNAGTYRLRKRKDGAFFGYTHSPQSWKRLLHLPQRRLWRATRTDDGEGSSFTLIEEPHEIPRRAFLGVRSCELHAIDIQTTVFTQGPAIDPLYKALRDNTFIVAVNCGQPGGTCFCASMQTGPQATSGFDLALTEIIESGRHVFLVEVGSEAGVNIMQDVPHTEATEEDHEAARRIIAKATRKMGRSLKTAGLHELLATSYEHPHWDDVAERCMACSNCTAVCPTCFCVTTEDTTDLNGTEAERWQRWDSCFTTDFSYIHGGSVRTSTMARYRQWATHKFSTWIDQFGTSGCIGCGRCITWCPVGIDITKELRALQKNDTTAKAAELSTLNMV